ncbi:MAG: acyltransferase [Clostridia bacterium]|nr:acyltransferase [Clostridia bacterium]
MQKSFSKQDTHAMKGVAIILMLCHHLFYATEQYVDYLMFYTFTDSFNITVRIAMYAKMCVPIFILLSAYGLSFSYEGWRGRAKSKISFVADRYLSLYFGFVLIFILGLAGGLFWDRSFASVYGESAGAGLFAALDSLGLASLFHTPTANVTWWYMSFAAVQISLFPIFYRLVRNHGAVSLLLIFGLMDMGAGHYGTFLHSFSIMGIYLATRRGFDKAREWSPFKKRLFSKAFKFALYGVAFWLMILVCEYLPETYDGRATDFRYWGYGLFGVVLTAFLYEFVFPLKPLRLLLAFVGRHSANIFMMHTFFFFYFWPDFYYDFEKPELIFAMLLATTLAASAVLELFKKLFRYDRGTARLRAWVDGRLNGTRNAPAGQTGALSS